MQKMISMLAVVAMVLFVGAASAVALPPANGMGFVDANGDGVCDHYRDGTAANDNGSGNRCPNSGACPQNGTGCGFRRGGAGMGFVDANGDGVCDHYRDGTAASDNGSGNRCPNSGACPQNGTGRGFRRGGKGN